MIENAPADRLTDDDPSEDILDERRGSVAERTATRQEAVSTGVALLPEGVRTTRWVVPLDCDRTLVARTHDQGQLAYTDKQEVLDRMVRSLRLLDA